MKKYFMLRKIYFFSNVLAFLDDMLTLTYGLGQNNI